MDNFQAKNLKPVTNKLQPIGIEIISPLWEDPRFSNKQTVFLLEGYRLACDDNVWSVPNACYVPNEELMQIYSDEAHYRAWRKADKLGYPTTSAARYEAYLRELVGDPDLILVHIQSGVDDQRFPYRIYGYISGKAIPIVNIELA
jgi:hypothetical protein